jgi:hypothetical protein
MDVNTILTYVVSIFSGISVGGLISAIIYGCLKGAFSRTIAKIDVDKAEKAAVDKGIEKIQNVTFTHSIQPLVESELKKITEEANAYIKRELEETQRRYLLLVDCVAKLAAYFDNSIGVPDSAKEALKEALEIAENAPVEPAPVESVVVVEETTKTDKTAPEKHKNQR